MTKTTLYLLMICILLTACAKSTDEAPRLTIETPTLALTATLTVTPSQTATVTSTQTPNETPTPLRPDLPEGLPYVIGSSIEGRAMEIYRFGNGIHGRLIIAGIHGGNEANTIQLAYELIEYLQTNPQVVPEDVTLYILPNMNPDGYARGALGRSNSNGVDLNRNWFFNWKPDWSRNGCWNELPITAGEYPLSEPETQHLAYFMLLYPVEAAISYHSARLGIFAGGIPPSEASLSLADAIDAVSPYPYPPLETNCEYTGQFIDWASSQGIAAVDVELRDHSRTDFEINLKVLDVFLRWSP